MQFKDYLPSPALQPFIKTYRIIESQEGMTNRVLPNTSLTIAFRFSGQISYANGNGYNQLPSLVLSGLRKSVRLFHYAKNTAVVIVLFKEMGAAAFFGGPVHELFEESVSLDNFISPTEMFMTEEQLSNAGNHLQRIAVVDRLLLQKLYHPKSDELVSTAIAKIHAANGMIRIRELAAALYTSQDALEKRFRKVVGATPKQFSSIIKMDAIIRNKQTNQSLIDMALDNGYFDQAHFNNEFKRFTGQTPTDFFQSASFW